MDKRLRKEIEEILRRKGVKPDCKNRARLATRRTLTRSERQLLKSVAQATARDITEAVTEHLAEGRRHSVHRHRTGKTRGSKSRGIREWRIYLSIKGNRLIRGKRHYGA